MAVQFVSLNTGAKMPAIGFGTWKIFPNGRAKHATEAALKAGYRLIDTARIYGNERGVGQAIRGSGVPRQEIFVTTKLWNNKQGFDSAHKAFNDSLKRLGLDFVDLYLLHWPVTGKRLDSWRALEEIYASGRARSIGVSNFTVRHLIELLENSNVLPAVNQVEFHPFLYKEQRELLEFCKQHNILVEAYSPLAHGHRLNDPLLAKIARKHGKSSAQIVLRWAIQHGTLPLPKSTNPERQSENLAIFDFLLSDTEMKAINGLSDDMRTCDDPNLMA